MVAEKEMTGSGEHNLCYGSRRYNSDSKATDKSSIDTRQTLDHRGLAAISMLSCSGRRKQLYRCSEREHRFDSVIEVDGKILGCKFTSVTTRNVSEYTVKCSPQPLRIAVTCRSLLPANSRSK